MDFTYERANTGSRLETYEWANIWLEQPQITDGARVMIIGDSISCGYRRMVTELSCGSLYADGIGTSKALDNEYYPGLIDYVLSQEPKPQIIQLNNGLHGWHLSTEEYRYYYEKMVDFLLEKTDAKHLVLALTIPVRSTEDLNCFDDRNGEVRRRNQAVLDIAQSYGLTVNDFYALTADRPQLWTEDGIHLTDAGYRLLASRTLEVLRDCLK